jgi:hypothetical protein
MSSALRVPTIVAFLPRHFGTAAEAIAAARARQPPSVPRTRSSFASPLLWSLHESLSLPSASEPAPPNLSGTLGIDQQLSVRSGSSGWPSTHDYTGPIVVSISTRSSSARGAGPSAHSRKICSASSRFTERPYSGGATVEIFWRVSRASQILPNSRRSSATSSGR